MAKKSFKLTPIEFLLDRINVINFSFDNRVPDDKKKGITFEIYPGTVMI